MSRIGKKPIVLPNNVDAKIEPDRVIIKGPRGILEVPYSGAIQFDIQNREIHVSRKDESKKSFALHGLYRALVANAVRGVTEGFEIGLEVLGTGYRVEQKGKALLFYVGYSHAVEMIIPEGIEIRFDSKNKNRFYVKSNDKYLVGQYAAVIRNIRPPMTYKAKGIKYIKETLRLKQGKAAAR